MIILDTNVVSEPLRPQAAERVIDWLDGQSAETLFLTTINLAELLSGVELLPQGQRRTKLGTELKELLDTVFGPRILVFDQAAAEAHARIFGATRAKGFNMTFADAQIAAIATVHGMIVATRDAEPFRQAGVEVIDPWLA